MREIELGYCTNVHALGTTQAWFASLGYFGPAVRAALGWRQLALGLWWQAPLAAEAARDPSRTAQLLKESGLRAYTCNAFPYGNFHDAVVKTKVYLPEWCDPARLAYTKDCATVMAALIPEGGFGTLSTLPLGWRRGWDAGKTARSVELLLAWVDFAADLERRTGRRIALALEAEPGCILERTPQVLAFWKESLRPAAGSRGATLDRHLGLCYDTCHQAVQYEAPEEALGALADAGIPLHKMQLSSGLEFEPGEARGVREAFAEPKFLHQTRTRGPSGTTDYDDLPEALERADRSLPWRTHFHLPLQAERLLEARTTREDMLRAYRYALKRDLCRHFEVETYTWSVLPEAERPKDDAALAAALARELDFVARETPDGVRIAGRGGL